MASKIWIELKPSKILKQLLTNLEKKLVNKQIGASILNLKPKKHLPENPHPPTSHSKPGRMIGVAHQQIGFLMVGGDHTIIYVVDVETSQRIIILHMYRWKFYSLPLRQYLFLCGFQVLDHFNAYFLSCNTILFSLGEFAQCQILLFTLNFHNKSNVVGSVLLCWGS